MNGQNYQLKRRNKKHRNKKPKQQGLTLVELLIATALGVFLLSGILQVYLGSRQSSEVIQAQSEMQEAGRFGMVFMGTSMRQAGYINAGVIDAASGDQFAAELLNILDGEDLLAGKWPAQNGFEAGAVVAGSDTPGGLSLVDADSQTDVVSFRLQGDPDGVIRDCEGRAVGTAETDIVRMHFYIDNERQLRCQTAGAGLASNSAILVSGVEHMELQYGVAGSARPGKVEKYVTADAVSSDEWADVVAVRVGLLTASDNKPLDTTTQQYDLLDQRVSGSDGRARQVFTQTIALRNKLYD